MNTVIFEHVDNSTTELLKQLAEKMGLRFKTKREKGESKESGIVTNPELLQTIEDYESGRIKPIQIDILKLKKDMMKHGA